MQQPHLRLASSHQDFTVQFFLPGNKPGFAQVHMVRKHLSLSSISLNSGAGRGRTHVKCESVSVKQQIHTDGSENLQAFAFAGRTDKLAAAKRRAHRAAPRRAYFDAHAAQRRGHHHHLGDWNAGAATSSTNNTPRHSERQKAFPAFHLEQLPASLGPLQCSKGIGRPASQLSSDQQLAAAVLPLLQLVLLALHPLNCSSAPSYAIRTLPVSL